ncbi:MAG: esterase-like activity of phytase family protein, partial [Pseudomonadota bacterium]
MTLLARPFHLIVHLFSVVALFAPLSAMAEELSLIGSYQLPTGLKIDGVEVGGLSAIDYDAEKGVYLVLSDDQAQRGPARYYEMIIDLRPEGIAGVDIRRSVPLKDVTGTPWAERTVDPEALRVGGPDLLYWAHEGNPGIPPYVGTMTRDGRSRVAFAVPDYYAGAAGVRRNKAFESLTVEESGTVLVATENALAGDGPEATLVEGSTVRMLRFDAESGEPVAEFLYLTDPVAARPIPAEKFGTNGLVELLARKGGGLYALERSFSVGQGNTVKLFVVDLEGASNVLGQAPFPPDAVPAVKTLLLTIQAGGVVPAVDNLEGLSYGPEVDGKATL